MKVQTKNEENLFFGKKSCPGISSDLKKSDILSQFDFGGYINLVFILTRTSFEGRNMLLMGRIFFSIIVGSHTLLLKIWFWRYGYQHTKGVYPIKLLIG